MLLKLNYLSQIVNIIFLCAFINGDSCGKSRISLLLVSDGTKLF